MIQYAIVHEKIVNFERDFSGLAVTVKYRVLDKLSCPPSAGPIAVPSFNWLSMYCHLFYELIVLCRQYRLS